jgi:hypothetical protein
VGLPEYFEALAKDWRGWSDERRWESLKGDVPHRWNTSAELLLDAGGLDELGRQARRLL